MEELKKYLPANSYKKIVTHFDGYFELKIVRPRKTKLGDFRPALTKSIASKITINNDLNPYSFLITLVHEIAHHNVWLQTKKRILPHGNEWKTEFKYLMLPFLHPSILPEDIIKAVSKYLINPKASSCSDVNLYRTLSLYDIEEKTKLLLETLPQNSLFSLGNQRIFKKGMKLRTRFKCTEISTKKQYFVHGLAAVKIVDK
ncbi:MAG: sprT domain-containing protein [Flavobacteriales bacterium]|nr:sprT domain-containing protein [Flavobacteriales bacterium]